MTAERLREAATVLRERAESATPAHVAQLRTVRAHAGRHQHNPWDHAMKRTDPTIIVWLAAISGVLGALGVLR